MTDSERRLPRWLDRDTAASVVALFRARGVVGPIAVVPTEGGDEAIFAITASGAANMSERALTEALTDRLQRKVWVTTDAFGWPEEPIALTDPEAAP